MKTRSLLLALALMSLVACSSQPSTPAQKPAPKPTETSSGREVMQRLYVQARGWAPDAKPVRLESIVTSDASGQNGHAAVWRGYFASVSRRAMKPYVWSGSTAEGAPERGLTPGVEDTWTATNTSTQAWDLGFLKVDSDKAYRVAQEHGGEKLTQAGPAQPVQYVLDWNPRESNLIWHVIYGTNVNDAKLRVAVNASDGKFIRVEK
ncbi:MAG: hypothetical protein ACE14L_04275 [Terriglobales bacterium]